MNITPATIQDIPKIQSIARESWQSTYLDIIGQNQIDYMLSQFYSEEELLTHFENANYHYFLVEEKGSTLGFAGFEDNFEPGITKLHRIYFLPQSKGSGMGGKTLDFIFEHCKNIKANSLILNVNKYNSAKYFYLKKGMTIQKEIVLDIGEGYVMDDYIMEKTF